MSLNCLSVKLIQLVVIDFVITDKIISDECSLCPRAKYANATGNTQEIECLRCPAGKFAAEEGSKLCSCITTESCDLVVDSDGSDKTYFKNDVDFFRETVPFEGRW